MTAVTDLLLKLIDVNCKMHKNRQLNTIILMTVSVLLSANIFASAFTEIKNRAPLRWKNQIIPIAFSNSFTKYNPNIKPESDVKTAIRHSLDVWEKAANIKFDLIWTDKQTISPKGRFGDGVNLLTIAQTPENLLLFSQQSENNPAQTRIFYNKKGFITEADIVLNPYQQFSTDGSIGTYDLETTLAHEIGHLLGLEHSAVLGALMNANYGKNGVFNLSHNITKQLDRSDISAARSLYGADANDSDCCGNISGKIVFNNHFSGQKKIVWVEKALTGQIAGQAQISNDGSYSIGGLSAGKYRVFCQTNNKMSLSVRGRELGIAEVSANKDTMLSKALEADNKIPNFEFLGINSELSNIALNFNAGSGSTIYLGNKITDPKKVKFGFDTPNIKITNQNLTLLNFNDDINAVSLSISVAENTPAGSYSLYIESEDGQREYMIGGISVNNQID